MFVNQVCSVVAIVGKNQDTPFLGEVFGATLRERDILLFESPKLYDCSRRTTRIRYGLFFFLSGTLSCDCFGYSSL